MQEVIFYFLMPPNATFGLSRVPISKQDNDATRTNTSRDQYFHIHEFQAVRVLGNGEDYEQLPNIRKYRFNVVDDLEKSAFVGQKIEVFLGQLYLGHITKVDYESKLIL